MILTLLDAPEVDEILGDVELVIEKFSPAWDIKRSSEYALFILVGVILAEVSNCCNTLELSLAVEG